MKAIAFFAGVVVLASAALGMWFQRSVTASPLPRALEELVFEPDVVDLGDVPINTSSDFQSSLHNRSKSVQKIDTIDAPCTCTSVDVSSKNLRPNETTQILGVFRSGMVTGPISRRITIKTSAGATSKLDVRANVICQITVDPTEIHLAPDFTENPGDVSETWIWNHSPTHVDVAVSALSDELNLKAELERARIEPGQSTRLFVASSPTTVSPIEFKLKVTTSDPAEPAISIPVRIAPRNGITVTPRVMHFGVVSREQFLSQPTLNLVLNGKVLHDMRVLKVTHPDYLRYDGEVRPSEDAIKACFSILEPAGGSNLSGMIEFHFSRRHSAEPAVPIVVKVRLDGFISRDGK